MARLSMAIPRDRHPSGLRLMNSPLRTGLAGGVMLALSMLPSCEWQEAPALQLGKPCTVQFRRDALGAGASNPISTRSSNHNGADTSIRGTLTQDSPDWVVIEMDESKFWIPKSVILLIQQ